MSWTEDRVEILKTLWVKGLTASQIAGELGGGVTRNAVIGKVHRLKLAARIKPATSSARSRNATRTSTRSTKRASSRSSTNSYSTKRTSVASPPSSIGATALKHSPQHENELKVARNAAKELIIPLSERITLLELSEEKCKWPIGDPLNSDFHFCGRKSLEGKPYCEPHSKRAYHKIDKKKR